jgi:hypothetical protein
MASTGDISKIVVELYELVKNYLLQQTLVPLKRLGRYIGMGLGGSVFISLGLFLLSIGFLRYLQTLSVFEENLSFVPYLLVSVSALAVIGILFFLMTNPNLIKSRTEKNKGKN